MVFPSLSISFTPHRKALHPGYLLCNDMSSAMKSLWYTSSSHSRQIKSPFASSRHLFQFLDGSSLPRFFSFRWYERRLSEKRATIPCTSFGEASSTTMTSMSAYVCDKAEDMASARKSVLYAGIAIVTSGVLVCLSMSKDEGLNELCACRFDFWHNSFS